MTKIETKKKILEAMTKMGTVRKIPETKTKTETKKRILEKLEQMEEDMKEFVDLDIETDLKVELLWNLDCLQRTINYFESHS